MGEASTIVAEEKSTHKVETFILGEPMVHPNADRLQLFKIGDTDYTYVGNAVDWQDRVGKPVAWVPPDSLVDTLRPEFLFLMGEAKYDENGEPGKGGYARIKAKKLRGVVSYGLMIPIEGIEVGTDAAQILGVKHYEPKMSGAGSNMTGGECEKAPTGVFPKYDVDAFLKYGKKMFNDGEPVVVTEKIHGANGRYVFVDGKMYCGSRTEWKKEFTEPPKLTLEELKVRIGDEEKAKEVFERAVNGFKPKKNLWWVALESAPQLRKYCEANPGVAVYGEVFGQVQKGFQYGAKNGEVLFRAFDILQANGSWMDAEQFLETCKLHDIPHVPVLHQALPFNFDELVKIAEGNSTIPNANHIREGVVVKPIKERWDSRLGRVNLKIINPAYSEKN